jgi:hypothetical protein
MELYGRARWSGLLVPGSRIAHVQRSSKPGDVMVFSHAQRNHAELVPFAAHVRGYYRAVESLAKQTGEVTDLDFVRLVLREYA